MQQTTPTYARALRLACAAPKATLNRCRGGFFDRSRYTAPQLAPVVTVRMANTLVRDGLAEFDDPDVPSRLTLTAAGIRAVQPQPQARAA